MGEQMDFQLNKWAFNFDIEDPDDESSWEYERFGIREKFNELGGRVHKHTGNGERHFKWALPTSDTRYKFRNSWTRENKASTQQCNQICSDGDKVKITIKTDGLVYPNYLFWGFSINTWVGRRGGTERWRGHTYNNMRPLIFNKNGSNSIDEAKYNTPTSRRIPIGAPWERDVPYDGIDSHLF